MSMARLHETVEEPLWFGPEDRPLMGWLTRPLGTLARGGVLCAPPIGREARAGRRAIRSLALTLAGQGFVTLRFDYDGTGDSSGELNDVGRDELWVDSVVEAKTYLHSLGLESVSAVGMRLGATLIGVAADRHHLEFETAVLWDPCDSGRSYLRELHALEALRREDFEIVAGASIETSEFVFSTRAAEEVRRLSLSGTSSVIAKRTLVVVRSDRAVPKKLKDRFATDAVEWQTTGEQAALLDVNPLGAVLPNLTLNRIVTWLCKPASSLENFVLTPILKSAVVNAKPSPFAVTERIVEIGPRKLFGVVSEPVGEAHGPLIVMFNVANEEHTGPARLWVDLSRRWAGFGMRCVRFDLSGLGDSPWTPGQLSRPFYFEGWRDDIMDVARELNPEDPSNAVFVGLCSGAYWAIEAALALGARGVCAINPPVCMDFLHGVRSFETSQLPLSGVVGKKVKRLARHEWRAAVWWYMLRFILPRRYAEDLFQKLASENVNLLLLYNAEDLSPFVKVPFLSSMDVRRLSESSSRRIEFVPGLDHAMHFAEGRTRAVETLDQHVLNRFGGVTTELGTMNGDD
jgi:pimeloyl-ACP methyl ester carboxylesterase